MVENLLICQLVLTLLFSIIALATSSFVIFRIFMRERKTLDETEKHAFELYDAIFQSFIPRTLGDKLSNIYKTEVDAHAMNDKPIPISTKQVNPSQKTPAPGAPPPTSGAAPPAAGTTPNATPGTSSQNAPPPPQPGQPQTPAPTTTPATPEIPAATPAAAPPQSPAPAVAQAPVLPP